MTLKRLSLTVFFIVLTLFIGLVSVNSSLTVKAQNSALYQSGNGNEVEQETDQSQASNQNGQIVSGDSSITSGNNIDCKDRYDSDALTALQNVCDKDGTNEDTAELVITVEVTGSSCDGCVGVVRVSHMNSEGETTITYDLIREPGTDILNYHLPIGDLYTVSAFSTESDDVQISVSPNSDCKIKVDDMESICIGHKGPQTTNIFITLSLKDLQQ